MMPITNLGYQLIYFHSISRTEGESIFMIPITEKEEKALDKGYLRKVINDNDVFEIESNQIIAYGEIDFTTNSDDYNSIEMMNWLESLGTKGLCVPSDYDYEEHCCYTPLKKVRYYETFNPAIIAQYKHAVLGKPQRCCIFKKRIYGYRRTE